MRHGLCFGINDYPGTDSDLQGCVNDANDWAELFRNQGFDDVGVHLDAACSKANMMTLMDQAVTSLKQNDLLVISYSGHGTYLPDQNGDEPDHNDEAICPTDIMTTGEVILDDDLATLLQQAVRGSRVVFLSDSCHSGTVARFNSFYPSNSRVRFLPPSIFNPAVDPSSMKRAAAPPPGRHECLLLSGCMDWEYSYDAWFGTRANGAFTRAAIRALSSLDLGATTYYKWWKAIRTKLPTSSYPQTPNIFGYSYQKQWKVFK